MKKLFLILRSYSPGQIFGYLFWRLKIFIIHHTPFHFPHRTKGPVTYLDWVEYIPHAAGYTAGTFRFINLEAKFTGRIKWDFSSHGKLWNFHLQAFEYLFQPDLQTAEGENLMVDFADYRRKNPGHFEPFPASLRLMNWVKYISMHAISNKFLIKSVQADAWRIYHTVEWHLRNNHILENGFALLFAGTFLNDEKLFTRGKGIVQGELSKQVLPDGAHFERSAMYHQLMLNRVLDCIQLLQKGRREEKEFILQLAGIASLMTAWMNEVKFENGDLPLMNDAAFQIAPAPEHLNRYAAVLKIPSGKVFLKECGFRKIKTEMYECLVDVGGLEPAANPGHAHADSLHFILYVKGDPFIIDSGTSTYDNNPRRVFERSTAAHNTVVADGKNQSELWNSFRVGKRAKILGVKSADRFIEATVKYSGNSILHTRRFEFSDHTLTITDQVSGDILNNKRSFLYVDKKSHIAHAKSKVHSNIATIDFRGDSGITVNKAFVSEEFNKTKECDCIIIQFNNTLITTITFHKTGEINYGND